MVTSQSINSGASIASANVTPPSSIYTQEYFNQHINQDLSKIETSHNTVISMTFPTDIGKYYMTLDVSAYTRQNLFNTILNPIGAIRLPIPIQLVDNHGVSYDQAALGGIIGGAVNAGMSAREGNDNILAQVKGLGLSAGLAALNEVVPAVDAARVLTGLAPNQFLTVALKGPQYKKHHFTWKLSPRNDTESENIRKIIANLNEWMAPGIALGGSFFTTPQIFNIKLIPNSRMLYKFLPAVLENMTVNYTPSGQPAFYHGTMAPDTVELSLEFLEVEYWLSGRGMYEL